MKLLQSSIYDTISNFNDFIFKNECLWKNGGSDCNVIAWLYKAHFKFLNELKSHFA